MNHNAAVPHLIVENLTQEGDLLRVRLVAKLNGRERRISVRIRGTHITDIQADDGALTWLEGAGDESLETACKEKALEAITIIRAAIRLMGGSYGR